MHPTSQRSREKPGTWNQESGTGDQGPGSGNQGRGMIRAPVPGSRILVPLLFPAFTMLELMVVLVVVAILAAMVIPQISGTGGMAAQASARRVMADLEYAQNQAITTQALITVTFNPSGNSYTVSNASGPLIHPITKQAYVIDFDVAPGAQGVRIDSASFTGGVSSVTFDSLGAPDRDGTVRISGGSMRYDVAVAPVSGRVTVTEAP